ncbi:MAG: MFS transporter [Holosporaceae bacterium]|jgi:DHA1 family bicyclomycin/chloramphenicol resistance-like MFS transporter|nr:MFS transporter [Holosporaceae bacterium]
MEDFKAVVRDFVLGKNEELSNRKITFFLLFLNVVTSAAVSIYIPCLKQMAIDLETTSAVMQMTIVAHLIGEFFGRLFCGPFVETHGGRAIILPSLAISIIGHFGCMISGSALVFTVMRFGQAVGSSVVYIVSQSIINETFSEKEKSSVVGILELYQPIAWILSPFVGSILAEISNWRGPFFVLLVAQLIGMIFFWAYPIDKHRKSKKRFAISKLLRDYGRVLKNSSFVIYALIPGLFAGGYMIFAVGTPFICSKFFENNSVVAAFSVIPLLFYVAATFVYRIVVDKFGVSVSKRAGACIYTIFGVYLIYVMMQNAPWTPGILLTLMCLQCSGSAFLVPVSILKALQSTPPHSTCVGASTVVIFRNIVMSVCIAVGAKFHSSITTIMSCVFMTVATVLILIMMRKIIRTHTVRKRKLNVSDSATV